MSINPWGDTGKEFLIRSLKNDIGSRRCQIMLFDHYVTFSIIIAVLLVINNFQKINDS